jgi:hypothetical protein|tara:strand:+ start:134 stop:313 length:180 start_codon:yes stop_codon:yes gene_type:complete
MTETKDLRFFHFAKGIIHPTAANVTHPSVFKFCGEHLHGVGFIQLPISITRDANKGLFS